jgi:hypothetical protein
MATGNFDWDDDDDFEADEPKGRDVPDLRKAHRELKRQNKELLDQLTAMKQAVRERSVKDVLAAKGINEKVSRLIPEDITSAEEVTQWIEDFGDVFGIQQGTQSTESQPDPLVENPDAAALGRIAASQQQGAPFTGDSDQLASLIASATSPEALNKILFGNATGPQAV